MSDVNNPSDKQAENFFRLCRDRRSTRLFREKPVPRSVLQRIIRTAIQAPTACNRQLWHFVVITDKAVKERVCRISEAQQSYLYDAPALIAVFYDTTLESRNPCKTPYVTAGMAIYGALLAAEAEGVGAIYLGGIRRPDGVARALNAPSHATNLGLICLGYPDDKPPAPPRRALEEVVSWNTFQRHEKHFHADIRPHLWSLPQLSDFRDKLLWYKGIAVDGRCLHVDAQPRFSRHMQEITGWVGMSLARYQSPRVLDVLSGNADMALQILTAAEPEIGELCLYELTSGTMAYIEARLQEAVPADKVRPLLNGDQHTLSIPLAAGTVDVVICHQRLELFEDPGPLLAELRRVLAPEGRILLAVSNRFHPHMQRYRRMRQRNYALGANWNRGPERKYEPRQVERRFTEAGLRVVQAEGLQSLQWRAAGKVAGLCRHAGLERVAAAVADWGDQRYRVDGLARHTSGTLIYELARS